MKISKTLIMGLILNGSIPFTFGALPSTFPSGSIQTLVTSTLVEFGFEVNKG
jgi:hypothetical protein